MKKIIIAIDGFAGCGKSTTARLVAENLNYLYIDTGAMYRAVSLHFLRNEIPFDEENEKMKTALDKIVIDFDMSGEKPLVRLNNEIVESYIRTPEISSIVSPVSVHGIVRHAMVEQQREIGAQKGVVMDGRDIGTYVFPDAQLKIFMTADVTVRAQRRKDELARRGINATMEKILENLKKRDLIDSTRKIAPLSKAEDAIELDNTNMTVEQQVERVCQLAQKVITG